MLRQVGIPRRSSASTSYPNQLSGGLRQRAMIAMALSCHPTLLIADEPTTALDVTTQAQILDLMRELQHEYGMAIMLITHDLGVIAEMADDVVVMYLGQVVEQAPWTRSSTHPEASLHPGLLRSIPRFDADTRSDWTRSAAPSRTRTPALRVPVPPALSGLHAGTCDPRSQSWPGGRSSRRELLPLRVSAGRLIGG